MIFAFFMMVLVEPQLLQAIEVLELNTVNQTQSTLSDLQHHHAGKKGHRHKKNHKQLIQTHTKNDDEEGADDDDDAEDTVSIEEVDSSKNSSAQTNSSQQATQIKDDRLAKEGSFMHMGKIANLKAAMSDAFSDSMVYMKNMMNS